MKHENIQATRRKFLQVLGIGTAGAPLAIKSAIDAEASRLAGFSSALAPLNAFPAPNYGAPQSTDDWGNARIAASQYAKTMGVPEFVKETLWRTSQYVQALDPDLAAKRSWSMSVKISEQRQRNYHRELERLHESARQHQLSSTFKALTGWSWPW